MLANPVLPSLLKREAGNDLIVENQRLVPGDWYLLASCEYCLTKHVLQTDPSKGANPPKDFYRSECPGCRRIGLYAASQVERYQHRLNSSDAK